MFNLCPRRIAQGSAKRPVCAWQSWNVETKGNVVSHRLVCHYCYLWPQKLRWIIFKRFSANPHTYRLARWRHYGYKWTFVLKECRVCRRVGGWEGAAARLYVCVCVGLLFIPIKSINQTVLSKEILTWTNKKKENVLQFTSQYCTELQTYCTTTAIIHTEIGLKKKVVDP